MRLLIVGGTGGTAVGESLLRASMKIPIEAELMDSGAAYRGLWLQRTLSWHVRGHRPFRLDAFSEEVLNRAKEEEVDLLLTIGLAPVSSTSLKAIRSAGIRTACYLTDDPWNPAHFAPWFLDALPHYDHVLTPRESNMGQLRGTCRGEVNYLPFGYDENLFFLDPDASVDSGPDILFVGTCDQDRVPILVALRNAGHALKAFGSYYDRWPQTRGLSAGQADAMTIRRATIESKINLCLVRRANRDGHVMRSFEMAACGACMLVEDTPEHRRFFGEDGQNVRYFSDVDSMLAGAKALLDSPAERQQMRSGILSLMRREDHRYVTRLHAMLRYTGFTHKQD